MRPSFGAIIAPALLLLGCNQSQPESTSVVTPTEAPAKPAPAPVSPWGVSTSRNELTGEVKITAETDTSGKEGLIVRLVGKKLDCYLTTDDFLETVENLHTHLSLVKYRLDDGNIVRQEWVISNDNTGLFVPSSSVRAFVQKLSKAKRLVIEYEPADVLPKTALFHVSSFPSEMTNALSLK